MIVGIDEVGRGALAGIVLVGAVSCDTFTRAEIEKVLGFTLKDSKKMMPRQRDQVAQYVRANVTCTTGQASVEEIESEGIVGALRLASGRALDQLQVTQILADAGLHHPHEVTVPTKWFVKGDENHLPIMLASIIAKVERDAIMTDLAAQHPEYKWEQNKGYGSQEHREAIQKLGLTPHHRPLFCRRTVLNVIR